MKAFFDKLKLFLKEPLTLLASFRQRMFFAIGLCAFSTLFLFLFVPFNISEWIVYTSPFKGLKLPGLAIISCLIIFLSQLVQFNLFKKQSMKVFHILIGFLIDTFFLTIPLSILYAVPANSYITEFFQTFNLVSLLLILWYIIGLSILFIIQVRQEKEEILSTFKAKQSKQDLDHINIYDENGQLRLSLKPENLLFFESADNYVIVHFRKEQRIAKEMIRNSLKSMETDLEHYNCIRCHRSYMVNLVNVSSIKKSGRSYEITIEGSNTTIPISRGYIKIIQDRITEK